MSENKGWGNSSVIQVREDVSNLTHCYTLTFTKGVNKDGFNVSQMDNEDRNNLEDYGLLNGVCITPNETLVETLELQQAIEHYGTLEKICTCLKNECNRSSIAIVSSMALNFIFLRSWHLPFKLSFNRRN